MGIGRQLEIILGVGPFNFTTAVLNLLRVSEGEDTMTQRKYE
jgi:hypothetical protein